METQVQERESSPIPEVEAQRLMDFPDAIREVMIGKRIQRLEWHDSEFGFIRKDFLTIHRNEEDFNWIVSAGDMQATDYVSF